MKRITIFIILISSTLFLTFNWLWMIKYVKGKSMHDGSFSSLHLDLPLQEVKSCESSIRHAIHICSEDKVGISQPNVMNIHSSGNSVWDEKLLKQAKLYGKTETRKRFLTIGIPTVWRKKENYLKKTLASLLNDSDTVNDLNVTIVVLFSDSDLDIRQKRAKSVATTYQKHIASGFLQLIQINPDLYPEIKIIRRTFNDSEERIRWRAKQVLDFAFLFSYCSPLSEYFLILEDDIIASPHYITAIKDFVRAQQEDWISLTFSGFLIIGRLLKNRDLNRLISFLALFYLEKPVDLLILQYLDLLVPNIKSVTRRIPGIFQHIGLYSSLDGKVQKAKDKSFIAQSRKFSIKNPEADIITTLDTYRNHYPELSYSTAFGFFWGMSPNKGDTFDIIFHNPITIKRIFINTGLKSHEKDVINYAEVKVSSLFLTMLSNKKAECKNFEKVSEFTGGKVDVVDKKFESMQVQCIRIEFVKKHSNWVIISEIAIFI